MNFNTSKQYNRELAQIGLVISYIILDISKAIAAST